MLRTISKTVKLDRQIHIKLDEFLNQLTYLYNRALQERIEVYKKHGKSISYEDQASSLTAIRNDPLLSEFEKFSCPVQQNTLKRLDKSYSKFFKFKKGFPRYKKRQIRSFETYQYGKPKKVGRRTCLKIKGLGRFSLKRSMPEGVKFIRLVRTPLRVKIQFICELHDTKKRPLDRLTGIDLGTTNRITLSDGTLIKRIKLNREELKRKQRVISSAKRGSNNRKKKVLSLAKEWERVRVREHNSVHRLTGEIVKKCNHIKFEDLKINNMVKNRHLSRSILEQQWGKIKGQLTYKAESAGGKLILVNPHYTSQTCSNCGRKSDKKLPLSQRVFNCIYCGYFEDRDINASINILNKSNLISGGKVDYNQFPMSAKGITSKENRDRGTLHSEQYR